MASPPVKKYFWVYLNVLLFLIVLARFYSYAITFNIVPDFPDPILAFLSKFNDYTDDKIDPISHLLGPVVFAVLLRWYSPRHAVKKDSVPEQDASTRGEPKQITEAKDHQKENKVKATSSGKSKSAANKKQDKPLLDIVKDAGIVKDDAARKSKKSKKGTFLDGKRQYIIVLGRLAQCAVFASQACKPYALQGCREKTCIGDCARRVFDLVLSGLVGYLELKGWNWDGGFIDVGLEKFWEWTKPAVVVKEGEGAEGEVVVGEPKQNLRS